MPSEWLLSDILKWKLRDFRGIIETLIGLILLQEHIGVQSSGIKRSWMCKNHGFDHASTIELLWGRKGGWGNAFVLFLAYSLSFSILLMKWSDRWIASPHIRHTIKLERHGLLFGILNPYKFLRHSLL